VEADCPQIREKAGVIPSFVGEVDPGRATYVGAYVVQAQTAQARNSNLAAQTIVRGTGIEPVTACQRLSPNLLSPNLCSALETVHGLHSGGCGHSSTEREFPSDKVYRRDDRGVVGVESLGPQGLAFVIIPPCATTT
jgi:hypothetical protein